MTRERSSLFFSIRPSLIHRSSVSISFHRKETKRLLFCFAIVNYSSLWQKEEVSSESSEEGRAEPSPGLGEDEREAEEESGGQVGGVFQ